MIVTIDGPAGAGKSTTARSLAKRLGFQFLDTGATFRAVTLAVLKESIDPTSENALAELLPQLTIELCEQQVLLNGEDVTNQIRSSQVSALASRIATSGVVRQFLAHLQHQVAQGKDIVSEGRDQGTVVFPKAACKFFLTANPEERARRRQRDLAARGEHVELTDLIRQQTERDERDSSREIAPLKAADDAIRLDNSLMTFSEVVDRMEMIVRERQVNASQTVESR